MATVTSVEDSAVGIGIVSPLGRGVGVATATTYRRGGGDDSDEFTSAGKDFVYDPSGALIGGTITSWKHVDLGNQFLVTDISVPVSSFPIDRPRVISSSAVVSSRYRPIPAANQANAGESIVRDGGEVAPDGML